MNIERLTFTNADGLQLSARLELPKGQQPKHYAIFAHCFTCNKNLTAVSNIARTLTQNDFGVLRFDFTGLGQSEGEFADTNFSSNIQDLISAAEFLEQTYAAPKLLIGHSLGGSAVLYAAKSLTAVQAVATIGAPSCPGHVQHLFNSSKKEINETGLARVSIGGREFTIKKQFLEDIEGKNLPETVEAMRKSILIMHSPQDKVVGIENAAELYNVAWHPKSFISLDGADHLLSNKSDSLYVGKVIGAWAERYIYD